MNNVEYCANGMTFTERLQRHIIWELIHFCFDMRYAEYNEKLERKSDGENELSEQQQHNKKKTIGISVFSLRSILVGNDDVIHDQPRTRPLSFPEDLTISNDFRCHFYF